MSKTIKNQYGRFNVTIDCRTNTEAITRIAPYDFTEYHWARASTATRHGRVWQFFRAGRQVEELEVRSGMTISQIRERITEELDMLDRNANLQPCIDRS